MDGAFESLSVPDGERLEYEDGFGSPEAPIVPVVHGADDVLVPATRRVLGAAASQLGREINWLRVYGGPEATERHGTPLPADTVRALRWFRVGLLGPLAETRPDAARIEADLREQVGITTAVTRHATLEGLPAPIRTGENLDLTVFRDVTEDVAAGLEYAPGAPETARFHEHLPETTGDHDQPPSSPTGYSVSPISRATTEQLVDTAIQYAFEHDRNTLTIAHQGDLRPGSEGAFREWACRYLADEYGDGTVDEATFRAEYDGSYPDDELVVLERRTDELCRALVGDPTGYDVVVAPALGGTYVSAIAAEMVGAPGDSEVGLGDGRAIVSARPGDRAASERNPIGLLLAGCLLFEYLGWQDAASVVRDAIAGTLADGLLPPGVHRRGARGTPVDTETFADAVVERLDPSAEEPGSGGVRSSAGERAAIKGAIASLHNALFEDELAPADVTLNQLLDEDEEADVSLPEVGINFYYWRRWSVERRLEVLLHELAHVDEDPGEPDHGDEFYERFVELVDIAADWEPELEAAFGEPIDFERVQRFVVESVHEETIEPDADRVSARKRWLREQFDLGAHY